MISEALDNYFPSLAKMPELKKELISISEIHEFDAGTVILNQGSYIKVIPLLVSGLVKVFKVEKANGNEVLLYYIKPGESCAMSVMTLARNEKSQVKATVEMDSKILVIPAQEILALAKRHTEWNNFIFQLFNLKFDELINVIEILTFSNKDVRLIEYLKKESALKKTKILHTTHQHIAYDLGSSREVISRLLKKLEHDGFVELKQGQIYLKPLIFSET